MVRIIVNLSDEVGGAVKRIADSERRSDSGYCATVIENQLRAAGLLKDGASEDAEFFTKLNAALKKQPALKTKIAALLPSALRARRAA